MKKIHQHLKNFQIAQLRNTIFWNASIDDYGVEKYAIYVDNELYDYANLNQYTFTRLDVGKELSNSSPSDRFSW